MSKSILAFLSLSILATISCCCGLLPTFWGELETPPPMTAEVTSLPTPPTTAEVTSLPTPLPTVEATSLPEPIGAAVATSFQGFGIDYCGPELAECAALGATWSRYSGIRTLEDAQAALDLAQSLNMKLVLRLPNRDWGWNGSQFDLTPLREFEPVFDHPALLGFYGLHEPWERFNADQLRLFYQQFQEVVAGHNVLLWHDLGHIRPTFTDGICDLCGVVAYPHVWGRGGEPANNWERTTRRLDEALQYMAGTSATLCVSPQVFGREASKRRERMPTPEEYIENVRLIVETYGVRCVINYPWAHSAYDHVLGDADQAPLREAVRQMSERYFGP